MTFDPVFEQLKNSTRHQARRIPIILKKKKTKNKLLAPGWRGAIVKDDVVARSKAIVYGAYFGVGRRCKLLIHIQEELIFRVEFHVFFKPLNYPLHVLGSFEEEFFLL